MCELVIVGTVVAAIAVSGSAHAGSASGNSTVASEGSVSCPDFLATNSKYPTATKIAFLSWAQGFMTSFNFTRVNILHKPPVNLQSATFPVSAQWGYLLNYCKQDHTARFVDAVITLMGAVQQAE